MVTMKRKFVLPLFLAANGLLLGACDRSGPNDQSSEVAGQGIDYNRESIDPTGSNTVFAKDGLTGNKSIQTGTPENKARDRALDLCNGRNSVSMTNPGGTATQVGLS